jgi:hypothetical protein
MGSYRNSGIRKTPVDAICLAIEVFLFAAADDDTRTLLRESFCDRAAQAAAAACHDCHTLAELEVRHGWIG